MVISCLANILETSQSLNTNILILLKSLITIVIVNNLQSGINYFCKMLILCDLVSIFYWIEMWLSLLICFCSVMAGTWRPVGRVGVMMLTFISLSQYWPDITLHHTTPL